MRAAVIIACLLPAAVGHGQELEPAFGFGTAGNVTLAIGEDADARAVAVDETGRVWIAGISWLDGSSVGFVARFDERGELDRGFGTEGVVRSSGESSRGYHSLALTASGAVAAGYVFEGPRTDIWLSHVSEDGEPVSAFGVGGNARFDHGHDDIANRVVQTEAGLLVGGVAYRERPDGLSASDFALLRIMSTGDLDPEFGEGGWAIASVGNDLDQVMDLTVVDAGLYAVGVSSLDFGMREAFAFARFDASGRLDPEFGTDGTLALEFDGYPVSRALSVLSLDGGLVAAGFRDIGERAEDKDLAAIRLDARGVLVSRFADSGRWSSSVSGSPDERLVGLLAGSPAIAVGLAGGRVFAAPMEFEHTPRLEPVFASPCDGPTVVRDAARRGDFVYASGTCSTGVFTATAFVSAFRILDPPPMDAGVAPDAGPLDTGPLDTGLGPDDVGVLLAPDGGADRVRSAGCLCDTGDSGGHLGVLFFSLAVFGGRSRGKME